MSEAAHSETEAPFPPPPIAATERLVPIVSWAEMHREVLETKVEFDLFWYDSVVEGVAYFFRWLSAPKCTVLVVWDAAGPTHIECRKRGDALASDDACAPIVGEVVHAFRAAGHWRGTVNH